MAVQGRPGQQTGLKCGHGFGRAIKVPSRATSIIMKIVIFLNVLGVKKATIALATSFKKSAVLHNSLDETVRLSHT